MMAKPVFRGLKLQLAIRLVAEQDWTEEEIAARLGVTRAKLQAAAADPYFSRRVEEERANLKMEDALRPKLGMPARSRSGSPAPS